MHSIIVILGPTSAGKTALSIELAKTLNGEVVSADSRQVYTGLDMGTGKVTKREMQGIRHHMLDVANPKKPYSASDYTEAGRKALEEIIERGKVPILVGGTGFYIDSLVGTISLPDVEPDPELRKKLSSKSLSWLQKRLQKLDPKRYKNVDTKNPVRLIRAIEIAEALGSVPAKTQKPLYRALYLGITLPLPKLEKNIRTRLASRIKNGMITEARRLHKKGLSWKRMHELGLEYRFLALHLQEKISRKELEEELAREILRYAKRQMTWFKKNKNILWLKPTQIKKATALSKKFLGGR